MQQVVYSVEVTYPMKDAHRAINFLRTAGPDVRVIGMRVEEGKPKAAMMPVPIRPATGQPYQRIPRKKNGEPRRLKRDGTPDMRGGYRRAKAPGAEAS